MSEKPKRKPLVESSGGFEDWLMPDYTRSAVEIGFAAVIGMISLLVLNNIVIACMASVFIASPAIVTPVVRHVLKKVEAQIAQRDATLGEWADTTEQSIEDFQVQQRRQIVDFETRIVGLVSKALDKDPTIKVDIDAVIKDIHEFSDSGKATQKPKLPRPDKGKKQKGDTEMGGPG